MKKRLLATLIAVVMIAASFNHQVHAASTTPDSMIGIWNGYYQVGDEIRTATLAIHEVDANGNISLATFYSVSTDGNGFDDATYLVDGGVNLSTGEVRLYGGTWLERPYGFNFYHIFGTVTGNRIEGDGLLLVKDTKGYDFSDIIGEWKGWYTNNSGVMDLDLYINFVSESGLISDSLFIFNPSIGNDGGLTGSYEIRGFVNPLTKQIITQGTTWRDRPSSYVFMDLLGDYDQGTFDGVADSSYPFNYADHFFEVSRISENRNLEGFDEAYDHLTKMSSIYEKSQYIEKAIEDLTEEQISNPDQLEEISDLIEFAVSDYGKHYPVVNNGVVQVKLDDLNNSLEKMDTLRTSLEGILTARGIELNREVANEVLVKAPMMGNKMDIQLDSSLQSLDADKLSVDVGRVSISLSDEELSLLTDATLGVEIESLGYYANDDVKIVNSVVAGESGLGFGDYFMTRMTGASAIEKFSVTIKNSEENKPLVIGLSSSSKDKDYDCVFVDKGGYREAIGGYYNKKADKVEVRSSGTGIYHVVDNRKYFHDITYLDADVKKAIGVLTAKGIINGKSENSFDPYGTISRAEFTKIIVKGLFLTDYTAVNSFSDVPDAAWYKTYVASSKKAGLINGYTDGTFKPSNIITKQEMVKICAASLHEQRKFKYPLSTSLYVNHYSDNVESWVEKYLALAEREGILVSNSSGSFNGTRGMTRADAAIMLYRVFKRL